MKNIVNISVRLILIILFISLFSCATTPEVKPERKEQIIEMGSYSVSVPPNKSFGKFFGKWDIKMDNGKRTVAFRMVRRNPLSGEFADTTLIQVWQNTIKPEGWHLSEEEIANDYRRMEEKIMKEEGVEKGQYKLENLKWDTITLGTKKLYTMNYTKLIGKTLGGFTEKATLFLYFPPDFNKNHDFYMFLLSFLYPRGAVRTFYPTEEVHYIINSFQQK